jgi:hypothetical protein
VQNNILANHVKIMHSWETNTVLTSIPTHVRTLVDIIVIWETQNTILERVYDKVMIGVRELLDTRQI